MRVLVTEPLSDAGLDLLRRDFQVDVRPELATGDLAAEIAPYDALVVRSQTKVSAPVIEAGENLKVVARAGIGLDNVDVETATRRGVMVVNAPQSNIVSAAEHTFALLLAQARNIPQANADLKAGRWERSKWQGVELQGKTLGIVGLGRIGRVVASRARAMGMLIVAYDPFIAPEQARDMEIELAPLDEVYARADFLTVHTPLTSETRGLVDREAIGKMKKGARIVNCARGGLIDEEALYEALTSGAIAGAALDVFSEEPPPSDHKLLQLEQVIVTPHLGASTREAQE